MSDHETVALQIRACGGALTGGFGGSQCGWKELGSGTSLSTPLPVTLAMAMALAALLSVTSCSSTRPKDYFQISVVDESTGRGVPLVELMPMNSVRYYTDSNGIIAFLEPGLMGREVLFEVHSHGYQYPKLPDGETEGVILKPQRGGKAVIRIRRINIAERLYRLTGEGIYRDSVLLGVPVPLREPLLNAQVMGTDGACTALYHGKFFWFFGDTNGVNTWILAGAVATSELPGNGGLDPSKGVNLTFFVDGKGFSKPMFPFAKGKELVWPEGPLTLPDPSGVERLVMRYDRGAGMGKPKPAERGLAIFRDDRQVFEKIVQWDVDAPLYPAHTPFRVRIKGEEYFYFAGGPSPAPAVRVRVRWSDVIDPSAYEGFTPVRQGSHTPELARDAHGRLQYAWKRNTAVLSDRQRDELIEAKKMGPEEAQLAAVDIETGNRVWLRSASVQWNEFRRRWIMIAQQTDGRTSKLGEIWYLEADTPLGPWAFARQILTHTRYSFYEVVQHPQFDQERGRLIYFSGTYSDFLANPPNITPRYDYNLIMYRLDLADSRLHLPVAVYRVSPGAQMTMEQAGRENARDRIVGLDHFRLAGRVWKSPYEVLCIEPYAEPVR
jgi:hypothetical protein